MERRKTKRERNWECAGRGTPVSTCVFDEAGAASDGERGGTAISAPSFFSLRSWCTGSVCFCFVYERLALSMPVCVCMCVCASRYHFFLFFLLRRCTPHLFLVSRLFYSRPFPIFERTALVHETCVKRRAEHCRVSLLPPMLTRCSPLPLRFALTDRELSRTAPLSSTSLCREMGFAHK